jgi:hypothetical protein
MFVLRRTERRADQRRRRESSQSASRPTQSPRPSHASARRGHNAKPSAPQTLSEGDRLRSPSRPQKNSKDLSFRPPQTICDYDRTKRGGVSPAHTTPRRTRKTTFDADVRHKSQRTEFFRIESQKSAFYVKNLPVRAAFRPQNDKISPPVWVHNNPRKNAALRPMAPTKHQTGGAKSSDF